MFKIEYEEVKPPIKSVNVTLSVEEIRLVYAALSCVTSGFTHDVGAIDGYDLWNKFDIFMKAANIPELKPEIHNYIVKKGG